MIDRMLTTSWRYGVPLLILVSLGWQMGRALIDDRRPIPAAPPNGYVQRDTKTRLVWAPNGLEGSFIAELIREGGDYRHPVATKKVKGTDVVLPLLDPGQVYRWRVRHEDTGMISQERWFRTPIDHVSF